MAYIEVDHSKFEGVADEIDDYISEQKKLLADASNEVNQLGSSWKGSDNAFFKAQWNKVTESGSIQSNMVDSLEAYRDLMKFAAKKYLDAQTDAIKRVPLF